MDEWRPKNRRERGGKKQKTRIYVGDFETTTVEDDCRVWGWGLVALPDDWQTLDVDDVEVGASLDHFIWEISQQNTAVYFHNLRFDGRFILDWLLKHGYEHIKDGSMQPGTFKTVISDMGQFYNISVRWDEGTTADFRDSYKKLPMPVATIAEAWKMDVRKGDIDYTAHRPVGHRVTSEEADYIRRDVYIVAKALGQQLAIGLQKLTVGSDALFEFKSLIGKKSFDRLFPVLSVELDAEIRRAYRGGFTYADPRFSGRLLGCGKVFDVNSLYPSVMAYKPIPYGEPEFVRGHVEPTTLRPLVIQSITFTATLKPDHIPCIQIKNTHLFAQTEYLTSIPEPTSLMVTDVDLALMQDHYDLNILEYNGGYRFMAATGIFDAYIDKWMRMKMHSTGGMRELCKLQLNSLYGKFATNPDVTGKSPYLDETGTIRLRTNDPEMRDPIYTAAGVFITSYARDITIRAAQQNYDRFAYADTDSLHLIGDEMPDNLTIDNSELGAWKHELNFEQAYYIRPKAYLEYGIDPRDTDGKLGYHNAIAGVPKHMSAELRFDDLIPGRVLTIHKGEVVRETAEHRRNVVTMHGKLTPKAVPGGIVLTPTPFELKL